MADLGDILSGAATGADPDYAGIEAGAALKGAQFLEARAGVPLRQAQTQAALQNADKTRLEALGLSRRQARIDALREAQATNPTAAPTLADMMDIDPNVQQATAGVGNLQEQGFQRTLGDPHADAATRLAASSALTHKVENPYAALPLDYVDLRAPGAAGAPAPDQLSQVGQATVGNKEADTGLKNAKAAGLVSTDNHVDLNEISFLAHKFNTDGTVPSFGMGQSKIRTYYLRALALDQEGIPITAESLHIPAADIYDSGAATAAPAAAVPPGTAVGANPGGNPHETAATLAAAGTYPVNNPADNAPAGSPPGTVIAPTAPVAATAPAPTHISPQEAAEQSAARQVDAKAAKQAIAKNTSMLVTMNGQATAAHNSYNKTLEYAAQLAQQRGPDGSPLINKAFIDWKNGITGDPVTGQFVHELTVAHDEYAKVISGATGAQGITDKGRAAADKLFNENMNLDTLKAIGQTMDFDMNNRRVSYRGAIDDARKGVYNPDNFKTKFEMDEEKAKGKGAGPPAATGPNAAPVKITNDADFNALGHNVRFIGPDGIIRRKP